MGTIDSEHRSFENDVFKEDWETRMETERDRHVAKYFSFLDHEKFRARIISNILCDTC